MKEFKVTFQLESEYENEENNIVRTEVQYIESEDLETLFAEIDGDYIESFDYISVINLDTDDYLIATTLLEGKVGVNNGTNSIILKPNQQSKVLNNTNSIEVLEVDPLHEVAWLKGNFSFNQDSLEDIVKILSRWYNINVIFESEKAKKFQFTGILEKNTSLENMLKFFESTSDGDLKYTLKNKELIIK